MDELQVKNARFYALRLINLRPRSNEELANRLREKGYPEEVIDAVLSEFGKKNFINDEKFSKLWIDSRMATRPKGELALREELKAKGIKEELIDKAIAASKKEYDEYALVKDLADRRMSSLEGMDKTAAKRRLYGYLKRRGFGFDIIMKVLEEEFGKRR